MRSSKLPAHPLFFFFNDTATTEIYTLSLHDALPIYEGKRFPGYVFGLGGPLTRHIRLSRLEEAVAAYYVGRRDRKSTRLNSSHANISYAVFCLKKNITDHLDHACKAAVQIHQQRGYD